MLNFLLSSDLVQACQQFGEVILKQACPQNCYATGRGLEVAMLGEETTAILHAIDDKGKTISAPAESLTCELIPNDTSKTVHECIVKKAEANQFQISYKATNQGKHQLHLKMVREHIKGSPFPVTVIKKLGVPIKTITGVKEPWGVAVYQRRAIIVCENSASYVSVFSST